MIEDSAGYKKLLAAVKSDASERNSHDYHGKLAWVVSRAEHYAERTGLNAADIIDAWESRRDYWYMNYYQECNQPEIKSDKVRLFDTLQDVERSIGGTGFRCPNCNQVTKFPYECNSGALVELINHPAKSTRAIGRFTDYSATWGRAPILAAMRGTCLE